jgi:hypothetical protein
MTDVSHVQLRERIFRGAYQEAECCGSSKPRDGLEHGQLRCVGDLDCFFEGHNIPEAFLVLFVSGARTAARQSIFALHLELLAAVAQQAGQPRFTDFTAFLDEDNTRFEVPIHEIVLSLENAVLERLYHPVVLSRIFDSEVINPTDTFSVGLLSSELQDSTWTPPLAAARAFAQASRPRVARDESA